MSGLSKGFILKNTEKSNRKRIVLTAILSLIFNVIYAVGNLTVGFYNRSFWFITLGAYYVILSTMRFAAVLSNNMNKAVNGPDNELFIQKFSGIMLVLLSFVLCGSVYLSIYFDVTKSLNEILVIAMATYAFTKITLAIINFAKRKKLNSPILVTLRGISLSDAAVSILSLQRLMLISFEGMTEKEIVIMNAATGTAVWLFVAILGILMTLNLKKEKH